MSLREERMRILEMVAQGKITAEEGALLLEALQAGERRRAAREAEAVSARWFRVRVTDVATGRDRVNINIPLAVVDAGLKVGARFVDELEGVRLEQIAAAVRSGRTGKILEVEDVEQGERVEIFVE